MVNSGAFALTMPGKTLLTFHEVYPSKEALEEALQGSAAGLPEQLEQLDDLLASMDQ